MLVTSGQYYDDEQRTIIYPSPIDRWSGAAETTRSIEFASDTVGLKKGDKQLERFQEVLTDLAWA